MVNKYEQGSVKWQLFETMKSNELLVKSCIEDIERANARMAKARDRADEYRKALEVLENE